MASYTEQKLTDPGYKRLILGGLALDFLADQLKPYIDSVITKLHDDLQKTPEYFPPVCTHATYQDAATCATCKKLVDFLNGEYRGKQGVKWAWHKVTDVKTWDANPWHLALMFMSRKQDPATNTGPQDTDMSGLTSLMDNCVRFKADKLMVAKVRTWRNKLAHHASFTSLGEQDFMKLLDDVKSLLHDLNIIGHIDKKVNLETELKRIQQQNAKAGDIFQMLHRDLQLKLDTLSAMVCKRSLYQQEEIADSKKLVKETQLYLADGGTGDAYANILKEQLENIDHVIQSLKLTGLLINRYDRPDFGSVNAMPWAKTAAVEIDVCFENITMTTGDKKVHMAGAILEDRGTGSSFSDIEDLLPTDPTLAHRILLCGPPGSSKSTVTKQLARIWKGNKAKERLDKYSVLLVIPVSMLTQSVTDSLVKRLMQDLCSSQQLDSILRHHQHALLVLDGYDEGSTQQQQLVDHILSSDSLSNVTVLVTSREGFIANTQVNTIYQSLGFSSSQKHEYVRKFFAQTDCNETICNSVLKQLEDRDSHISELCDIPLNTSIVCHMAANCVPLTVRSKTELYDRMYEFIWRRANDKYKKDGADNKAEDRSQTNIEHAFRLVEKVIYWHLLVNSYVLTDESIRNIISSPDASLLMDHLPQLGLTTKESTIFEFEERSQYTMHHKTTAEFIAAKHLCQLELGAKTEAVIKLLKEGPVSKQILQFFCGLESVERPEHLVHVMKNIGKLLDAGGSDDGGGAPAEVVTRGVSQTVNNVYTHSILTALVADVSLTDATVRPLLTVWAPILHSTSTVRQLVTALGTNTNVFQWEWSESGEDTLGQAVLRAGHLEGVEALPFHYMSAATTDHLLHALPRLTAITSLTVHLFTAEQCRDYWHAVGQLTALEDLELYGKGQYEAKADPGDAHTTPGDAHVSSGGAALQAPPRLRRVWLLSLPLRTAAQLAPLCGWARDAHNLHEITIRRCRVPCGTLRQELGAALRQRGTCMEYVEIRWQAGDGEEEDWRQLEQKLEPYAGKLSVRRSTPID